MVKEYPHRVSLIVSEYLKSGIEVSKMTIKRALKSIDYSYKRLRKYTAKEPSKQDVNKAQNDIIAYKSYQNMGLCDIYYYDETTFSMDTNVPYGWQKEYIKINAYKSQSLKVMGFLDTRTNDVKSYTTTDNVNSDLLIEVFDDFSKSIKKHTIVILDNAPTHKSAKFIAKSNEWKNRGLHLYFIPPYCPFLNKIEILWKFMKYYWFDVKNYSCFSNLTSYVNDTLALFGKDSKYVINFV